MAFLDNIKKWYNSKSSEQRKNITKAAIVVVFILLAATVYHATRGGKKPLNATNSTSSNNTALDLNQNTISKELAVKQKSEQQNIQKILNAQNKTISYLLKKIESNSTNSTNSTNSIKGIKSNSGIIFPPPPNPKLEPPPAPTTPPPPPNTPSAESEAHVAPVPMTLGGINVVSVNATASTSESVAKKKIMQEAQNQQEEVYLPTSFMEGILLNGLDAPTSSVGSNNPVPCLIRIQTPAVLPNEVKANLKGCFVIAEGVGDLATERANMRLVTISCIAKNGQAVIDQPIKGFVVDADGKIGLRGRVVSKMGSAIARSFIAGLFSGLGNAVQENAYTTTNTVLGNVSSLGSSASDIAKQGIGGGIYTASNQIAAFYLSLAKQSIPVVEIGAGKKVTIVVSQGEMLKLMDYCVGGRKCKPTVHQQQQLDRQISQQQTKQTTQQTNKQTLNHE
ncbi:MAG: TraB/VirB10 family protein [Thermoplasmata archaeon]